MSEIKRYQFKEGLSAYRESPNGEWVRWEDVKDLIDIANECLPIFKEYYEEMRKLNDLPSESRAITSEDIRKGMEAAIRGESRRPGVINGPGFVDQNELSLKERAK